jgi:hypothetical protein
MDRVILEERLRQANVHVALGEEHIRRQHEIIRTLERGNHDTSMARRLLQTFQDMQVGYVAARDRLIELLAGFPS